MISPTDLGLPPKFTAWRPAQSDALFKVPDSPHRFVGLDMPVGQGKSPTAVGLAKLTDFRTVILTATKPLADQYVHDLGGAGLIDVRGKNNYDCAIYPEYFGGAVSGKADLGPCNTGFRCSLMGGGCAYYDAWNHALNAQIVVTNYAYWMSIQRTQEQLGKVDLLILDEAHSARNQLTTFLGIDLDLRVLTKVLKARRVPSVTAPVHHWRQWAENYASFIRDGYELMAREARDGSISAARMRVLSTFRDYSNKVESLASSRGDWAMDVWGDDIVRFEPVSPAEYAEDTLFCNVPKIVFLSGTIRPKTIEMLGVGPDQYDFFSYPSTFPVARRPIYAIKTVRVHAKWTESDRSIWLARIDQILDRRDDRKGIIHTVSFDRARYILQHSRHAHRMILNESRTTQEVVRQFKESSEPLVLVSPSITTGIDLPDDESRFQIIAKVPWPDTRSDIMKKRLELLPDYANVVIAETLVQMIGRSVRSERDWAETFCVDDNFTWWIKKNKHLIPDWMLQAVRYETLIPDPLNY